MFPVATNLRIIRTPWATYMIATANVLTHFYSRDINGPPWRPASPVWKYGFSPGLRKARGKSAGENQLPDVLLNRGDHRLSGSHPNGTRLLCTPYRRQRSHQRRFGSILHLQSQSAHNVGSRAGPHLFSLPAHGPCPRLGFRTRVVFSTDQLRSEISFIEHRILGACWRIFVCR